MAQTSPPAADGYQTILTRLLEISQRLAVLERTVDQMDRTLRPYGDGTVTRDRA